MSSVARPTRLWLAPSTTATMAPADGWSMPMMHFMRVLLPLPLVPSSATVSPVPTVSETCSSARTLP